MNRSPVLPKGPPPKLRVAFTPRELEFIELRYGQDLQIREIAETMNISTRMARLFSQIVFSRLGISEMGTGNMAEIIKATKRLVKYGFIKL